MIIKSFVNKKQELNLDAINHRKRGYFEQGRGNNYGLDRPTVNIAAALSTFSRRSDWYLGTKRIGEVEVRGDECMDKSCGGLRTDEFPYFQNPVQPMECFTADLPIWIDIDIVVSNQEPRPGFLESRLALIED